MKNILILGIGNILLKDEGLGVYAIQTLERNYSFSENISLLDGGTMGMKLLPAIALADALIVVDAVLTGSEPGVIKVLSYEQLRARLTAKNSVHQISFCETLVYADMQGFLPEEKVIIGMEPGDFSPWGICLSEEVTGEFPELCKTILEYISGYGGTFVKKDNCIELADILRSAGRLNSPM